MNIHSTDNSQYSTADTVLATWLVMNGHEPYEVQNDSFPAVFIFYKENNMQELISVYNLGKAQGNITHFYNCYKRMLTLIKRGR